MVSELFPEEKLRDRSNDILNESASDGASELSCFGKDSSKGIRSSAVQSRGCPCAEKASKDAAKVDITGKGGESLSKGQSYLASVSLLGQIFMTIITGGSSRSRIQSADNIHAIHNLGGKAPKQFLRHKLVQPHAVR